MALVSCPKCGRSGVSDKAIKCPSCGYYFNSKIESDSNLFSQFLTVGNTRTIIYLGVFVFILAVCLLCFITTRCSVKGCYKGQDSGSSMCKYHKNAYREQVSYDYNNKTYDSRNINDLRFTVDSVETNSAATFCTVTVKNTGNDSFTFVEVKGSFKDAYGNVVGLGNAYAAGKEGIGPGESNSFRISVQRNENITSCNVSVIDYK